MKERAKSNLNPLLEFEVKMNALLLSILKIIIFALIASSTVVYISNYFLEEKKLKISENIIITVIMIFLGSITFRYSNHVVQDLIVITILMAVSIIDYYTKTIVDGMMYISGILFALLSISYGMRLTELLFGCLAGLVSYGAIYLLAKIIYKREAFGFGDVMFMGVIGIYLGLKLTLIAALLTFYVALIWIIVSKIVGRVLKRQLEIAFAPFMAISCVITMMFGDEIIKLYMTLFMI